MGMNVWGKPLEGDYPFLTTEGFEGPKAPVIEKSLLEKLGPKIAGAAMDFFVPGSGKIAEKGLEATQTPNIKMETPTTTGSQMDKANPTMIAGTSDGPLNPQFKSNTTMANYNPNERIYDDWIIKGLLDDGVVLPEEIKDYKDGYKQIIPTGGFS